MRVHSHKITPNTNADMKVPANAKVRIVPMLRKKLALKFGQQWNWIYGVYMPYLMQFISTGQNNGRKKQVEKELIVEADSIQYTCDHSQAQDQANHHTREDWYDRLMYRLNFFAAQDVAGEEGDDQEEDEDEQGVGREDLLLACIGVFGVVWVGGITAQARDDGAADTAGGHIGDVKAMLPKQHALAVGRRRSGVGGKWVVADARCRCWML
jgi:hypothetical protein